MHSLAKTSSTKLPEVHRVKKELNPNLRPEKQHAMPKKGMTEKSMSLTASISLHM